MMFCVDLWRANRPAESLAFMLAFRPHSDLPAKKSTVSARPVCAPADLLAGAQTSQNIHVLPAPFISVAHSASVAKHFLNHYHYILRITHLDNTYRAFTSSERA